MDRSHDEAKIGGSTLRDHSRNIVQRADELSARTLQLAASIQENLFGPEPKDTPEGAPRSGNGPQSVAADLTEVDGSLNVLSNALDLLMRIDKRIGLLREPRAFEATRDETAPARQVGRGY